MRASVSNVGCTDGVQITQLSGRYNEILHSNMQEPRPATRHCDKPPSDCIDRHQDTRHRRPSVQSTSSAWYTKPAHQLEHPGMATRPHRRAGRSQSPRCMLMERSSHQSTISKSRCESACPSPGNNSNSPAYVYQEMPLRMEYEVQSRVWGRFVAPLDRAIGSVDSAHSFTDSDSQLESDLDSIGSL